MSLALIVEAQMLIRKPVAEVFQAFIDPAITTRFWFTHSSGPLEEGKTIEWRWEMYGVSAKVEVLHVLPFYKIITRWGDPATTVEYIFEAMGKNETYLIIRNHGYTQTGDDLIQVIKDNTAGFTSVVDAAKAWLEHGIELNLVRDKFPSRQSSEPKTLNEWQNENPVQHSNENNNQ